MGKLSREKILEAALELVDREGLDKLSMRKLGRTLGVEAMSLYRYVKSKDELLNGIYEVVLSLMPHPDSSPDWRTGLSTMAHGFRNALLAHPAAVPLFATRPAINPRSLDQLEAALSLMESAGLESSEALDAVQTLYSYVVGHTLFRTTAISSASVELLDYQALSAERYPHLSRATPRDPDLEFEAGLMLWINGVESSGKRRMGKPAQK